MLIDLLGILFCTPKYRYSNRIWRRSLKGTSACSLQPFWMFLGNAYLRLGQIQKLDNLSQRHSSVVYYKALSLFLNGKLDECISVLQFFLKNYSGHREALYLLADAYAANRNKLKSIEVLSSKPLVRLGRTWIKLAELVETEADYKKVNELYNHCVAVGMVKNGDWKIVRNIVHAALRACRYKDARDLALKYLDVNYEKHQTKLCLVHANALTALSDLLNSTRENGFDLFVISGTLLGILRDGRFISHDTDMDLGIFDDFDEKKLIESIYQAGRFSIMPRRSSGVLRVRHINGTPIDIFTHYREESDYWHAGVKLSWHNSPFSLKDMNYSGLKLRIPDSAEGYLSENYGSNWKTEIKKNFDSAVDCPNSKIVNKDEFEIYCLLKNIKR